ncbi:protein kinase domain-containing protein [Rhodococcus sp. NPDC003348]
MTDPLRTRRDEASSVVAELSDAGFEDAQVIGRGGFGVVYRCRQPSLDRLVAVKVLAGDLDEDNTERFLREQRAMGQLTGHPNIVAVLHVGVIAGGRPYLVMRYHPQGSLEDRIRRQGPLSVEDVLRLGVRIAGALATAHRVGIIHRDVKPGNILVTDYGEPALSDFGIAHLTGGFTTVTGSVTGSPAFTAPEVLGGQPSTPASDVYSLGATLFAAFTGHAVFERREGEDVIAQFIRIATAPVPDLHELGVAGDVAEIVERAMARNPDERPSAIELGEQLQRLQEGRGLRVDDLAMPSTEQAPSGDDPELSVSGAGRTSGAGPRSGEKSSVRNANLPAEVSRFVGRRAEVAEARRLLARSRLVTLTGPGGVGKTRLALRVAQKSRRDFADGVFLVELDQLQDGTLLPDVVGNVLGVRSQTARPPTEVLAEFVAVRELLLVLDNCEHLTDAVAGLLQELLRASPKTRVLATSREALGIGGEALMRVPPLSFPGSDEHGGIVASGDAVDLFVDRALAALPGFEFDQSSASTVAEICRRLEGVPLAIELAAARLRVMSLDQILHRLTDRFSLLGHGSRAVPTRQQTLRGSIDWSYDLCTTEEREAWVRLSVFAGSFELDAAEQIGRFGAEENSDVLDLLTALIDKSILTREDWGGGVRYRMLESLREYGWAKADLDVGHVALARLHRNWYRQLAMDSAEGWIGPEQLDWVGRLGREEANLREALECALGADSGDVPAEFALEFAVALHPFWFSTGRLGEGRYWLGRVLEPDGEVPSAVRVKALCNSALLADLQGDGETAKVLIAKARSLGDLVSDPIARAYVDLADGHHSVFAGELSRADEFLTAAVEALTARGDLQAQVMALMTIGWARESQGDAEGAADCYGRVLAVTEPRSESVWRSYALCGIAISAWRIGDVDRTRDAARQALQMARSRRDFHLVSVCLEVLAWVSLADGDTGRTATLLGAAQAQGHAGGSVVVVPNMRAHHDDCENRARSALGQKVFEEMHDQGAALSFRSAIELALGERTRPAATSAESARVLTRREREVSELVAEGLTNKAIAARLVISPRTVDGHVEHVMTKLGFSSRAQIAAWVVEQRDR